MARVRLTNQPKDDDVINLPATAGEHPRFEHSERAEHRNNHQKDPRAADAAAKAASGRGLTERQWTISLLVLAGLFALFTFRGCVLPSGVGPKSKPAAQVTTTPQPANTVAPVGQEYTVRGGDTLSSIAQQSNTTVDALIQANNINRGTPLRVGQKLTLPPATSPASPVPN